MAMLTSATLALAQDPFNPDVYDWPLPSHVNVAGQPANFRFTSHIVNIAVPANEANNWNEDLERGYIQTVFDLLPDDKNFIILNYSGFYFPASSGLSGAHHLTIQNSVENIGQNIYDFSGNYNSTELIGLIRLEEAWGMRPNILNHEVMHQWNSYLQSAHFWLVDPSGHTGLVEEGSSCFENYRNTFEHVNANIYSYRQYISNGFAGELEGYLAGLWDAPQNLRTLKNYFHDPSLPTVNMGDYWLVQVFADEIYDVSRTELFSLYGGERIPNYQNSPNDYDAVVVVFSAQDFLSDNFLKGFHYSSVVNEFEDPDSEYNAMYDVVFPYQNGSDHPVYGRRQLNPYHASYKNMNFKTRLFDEVLAIDGTALFDIGLYPNPTNGVINLALPDSMNPLSISVFNVQGSLVTQSTTSTIDLSLLQTGMYFTKVITNKGSQTIKVIKE